MTRSITKMTATNRHRPGGRAATAVVATVLLAVAGGLAGAGNVLAVSHDIAITIPQPLQLTVRQPRRPG